MKKDIGTIIKSQEEVENKTSEMNYKVEGIKNKLDEAEDQINMLEDKIAKNSQMGQQNLKKTEKE